MCWPRYVRRGREDGSASIWVLSLAAVVLTMALASVAVGSAVGVRHRAESAADLAALAGAAAAQAGGEGCLAAARLAAANRARLVGCRPGADGSVVVVVALPLPPALRRWVTGEVLATARAGTRP